MWGETEWKPPYQSKTGKKRSEKTSPSASSDTLVSWATSAILNWIMDKGMNDYLVSPTNGMNDVSCSRTWTMWVGGACCYWRTKAEMRWAWLARSTSSPQLRMTWWCFTLSLQINVAELFWSCSWHVWWCPCYWQCLQVIDEPFIPFMIIVVFTFPPHWGCF